VDMDVDGSGDDASAARFSVSAGESYDEDIDSELDETADDATKEVFYVNGDGDVRWVDAQATYPVYAIGGVIAWNSAGTLTATGNNKYVLYHVFATNLRTDANAHYTAIMIPGNTEYSLKSAARDGALSEITTLSTGDWPMEETVPIATVIYQRRDIYGNGVEARIVSTDTGEDYIDWRTTSATGTGGASASDHGLLSGLADDDHSQYILHSLAGAANDFIVASGDDTYVKKTLAETGAILEGDIQHDNLQGVTAAEHVDWEGAAAGTIHTDNYIEGGAGTDTTAIHDNVANEITAITAVNNTQNTDEFLLEDASDSFNKKAITWATLVSEMAVDLDHTEGGDGTDTTAIHDNVAAEISALDLVNPNSEDHFLIEDESDSDNKKRVTFEKLHKFANNNNYQSIEVSNDSGSEMTKGDLCYISGDSSGVPQVELADADAEATASTMLVLIQETIAHTADGTAMLFGVQDGFSSLTPGAIQYVSKTEGETDESAPDGDGEIVRIIGYAISATEIFFNPDKTYVEVVA